MAMETAEMLDTHYMDPMADHPKKRSRDDEQELDLGPTSFSEHRNKRLQSLPVRTSTRQPGQVDGVTPLNAPPAELRHSHLEHISYLPTEALPQPTDFEMDMMDDSMQSQCQHQLGIDPSTGTHRMPTPIQPSFAAQIRGHQHDWNNNNGNGDQTVPRTMSTEADWHAVQNNRRLPSPISEGDDSFPVNLQPPSPHAMEHPMMDMEHRSSSQLSEADPDSPGPSPERRGHMRSKHTINTWTWQPGMKKSFSIGYRQDCEKCRLKVPGHFNHIVIS